MKALPKGWFRSLLLRNALALVLCAVVLVLTVLTGLLAARLFFNFWFAVFLYAFPLTWLYCLGFVLSARWKWLDLSFGVGMAILTLAFVDIGSSDPVPLRLLWSAVLSFGGLGAMTTGFFTAKLLRFIRADIRKTWQKRAALLRKPKTNLSR